MVQVKHMKLTDGRIKWVITDWMGRIVPNPYGRGQAKFDSKAEADRALEGCVEYLERMAA